MVLSDNPVYSTRSSRFKTFLLKTDRDFISFISATESLVQLTNISWSVAFGHKEY